MSTPRLFAFIAHGLLVTLAGTVSLHAAPVTFGKPVTLADEHDIITAGTLDRAVNLGGSDQTVNGVLFSAGNVGGGLSSVDFGPTTVAASADTVVYLNDSPTFAGEGSPANTFSKPYKTLLASAAYASTTKGTLTVTLSGLKSGTAYTIQFFVNDSRDFHGGGRKETVSSGGATSEPLVFSSTGTAGGIGQYVTGTFTADSPSQVFTFAPVDPVADDAQINAFQLRVTPAAPVHASSPHAKTNR